MIILYIETNFLMAIAKGQDSQAENLISNPPNSIRILIPNICYIEAISVFKIEKQARRSFAEEINKKINEARRDLTSSHAQSFCRYSEQAIIENQSLLNDIELRLANAIDRGNAKTRSIYLENDILQDNCRSILTQPETLLIRNDIMDNLILQCILIHASSRPETEKVFISNNTKDFGKPEVREALRNAGIRYFTMTQNFLEWFNSRLSS
ncbi:PIN domain-containing protein [Cronbergia sp. UHCC 0137]|uniref:PIN domain-containing protein n=1 Tax=Cronbergia sp. UHCC 0137 TaxID=3110239 RepID=UPI002B1EC7CD|nr:PIN domain-containing protein [Cronbergia sp. UHCC 0137]MEA5617802.1 PIN domain-containing protein [Cronbergia sp. UHCC 0137]